LDRFDAMRVFTRVAERRSFTRAALDLSLPRSTVTDAIKELERRLGVKLLERTTRVVRPTLDGEAYYQRCLAILSDMEDAESAFVGAKPRGILRVTAHSSLARNFLFPGLPKFFDLYPDIDLYLGEGDRLADLIREGYDCAIRAGVPRDSDLIARQIALLDEVTLASPAYLRKHGVPRHPDVLVQGHSMVAFHSSATGTLLPLEFNVDGKIRELTLPARMTVEGADCYIAAAIQGLGLIQIPHYRAEEFIKTGTLVQVLDDFPPEPTPVSLLYPRNRQLSPRVRVFLEWASGQFSSRSGGAESRG
jgi:DNA-binding transcriptional LysR family regulator